MMGRLRNLIWYAFLLVLFLVLYHVGTSFTIALVADDLSYMEPTLEGGDTCFLDRRRSTRMSLAGGDIVCFNIVDDEGPQKTFGRVIALPGMTISVRDGRLLVDGENVGTAPDERRVLATGLIVPRNTVYVGFDSIKRGRIPLAKRLVPYRDIIGRVMGK
jgi:signal peptidase I